MTKLPDHIAQAAEAAGYAQNSPRDKSSFMAGISWLYEFLSASAPEWDRKAFDEMLQLNWGTIDGVGTMFAKRIAEWQFEKDWAEIGLAETAKACVLVHHGKLETENAELKAKLVEANKVILEGLHIVDEEGYF